MKPDIIKSKDELLEELESLRQQTAEYIELQKRMATLEREHTDLKQIYDERTMELNPAACPRLLTP